MTLRPVKPAIAYTWAEAVEATGISETLLKRAVEDGDLVRRYYSNKPVFFIDDLRDFISHLPTERAS